MNVLPTLIWSSVVRSHACLFKSHEASVSRQPASDSFVGGSFENILQIPFTENV